MLRQAYTVPITQIIIFKEWKFFWFLQFFVYNERLLTAKQGSKHDILNFFVLKQCYKE